MDHQLKDFFLNLETVSHTEPTAPGVHLFDLGLVIPDPESPITADHIAEALPPARRHLFHLADKDDYLEFATALNETNSHGVWLVVDCQADPSPTIITLLKQLSEDNVCSIPNFGGKDLTRMTLNPETRIIFVVPQFVLDDIITYPYFVNLFGPVIRIAS